MSVNVKALTITGIVVAAVSYAERVSVAITADAAGQWAFHCHLLLQMEMGMFRVIEVSEKTPEVMK